jgi:hypothetical protein
MSGKTLFLVAVSRSDPSSISRAARKAERLQLEREDEVYWIPAKRGDGSGGRLGLVRWIVSNFWSLVKDHV